MCRANESTREGSVRSNKSTKQQKDDGCHVGLNVNQKSKAKRMLSRQGNLTK